MFYLLTSKLKSGTEQLVGSRSKLETMERNDSPAESNAGLAKATLNKLVQYKLAQQESNGKRRSYSPAEPNDSKNLLTKLHLHTSITIPNMLLLKRLKRKKQSKIIAVDIINYILYCKLKWISLQQSQQLQSV